MKLGDAGSGLVVMMRMTLTTRTATAGGVEICLSHWAMTCTRRERERNEGMPGLVVMEVRGGGLPGADRGRQDLIVCTCTRRRQRITHLKAWILWKEPLWRFCGIQC